MEMLWPLLYLQILFFKQDGRIIIHFEFVCFFCRLSWTSWVLSPSCWSGSRSRSLILYIRYKPLTSQVSFGLLVTRLSQGWCWLEMSPSEALLCIKTKTNKKNNKQPYCTCLVESTRPRVQFLISGTYSSSFQIFRVSCFVPVLSVGTATGRKQKLFQSRIRWSNSPTLFISDLSSGSPLFVFKQPFVTAPSPVSPGKTHQTIGQTWESISIWTTGFSDHIAV